MAVEVIRPSTQSELAMLSAVLDQEFRPPHPTTMWRLGQLYQFLHSDQLLLVAVDEANPVGAAVALRGRDHMELSHIAVTANRAGSGIGRRLFAEVRNWAQEEDVDHIKWCVSPTNTGAVAAYLAWGAHIAGWLDNGYGIDSDPCNVGESPRFIGSWRAEQPMVEATTSVVINDVDTLRRHLINGQRIVARQGDRYELAETV